MGNRVIKFRAWDGKGKQMVYVNGDRSIKMYDDNSGSIRDWDGEILSLDNTTPLMQFTGLTDKNGKDIFEGDAVVCHWLTELGITEIDCEANGVVIWDENTCGFIVRLNNPYIRRIAEEMDYETDFQPLLKQDDEFGDLNISYDVIGNIYENPDLLTPQHDRIGLSITEPDNEIINSVYVKDYDRESNFDNGIVAQGIEPR